MSYSNVEHQLLRLYVLLGDDETQLEEVYRRFQAADPDRRGSLKTPAELSSVLGALLSPKDFKRIDFDQLAAHFSSNGNRFDYTAFCKALQRPPLLQSESRRSRSQSPTKRRPRSPIKQQRRDQNRMRIDKRLESQRLLMESVRRKLLRGIKGGECDGYQGIQNALRQLDADDDGYLDAQVFTKKIVQRLNCPLTRPEREFLLEHLRSLSTEKEENVFDYEQIGRICNLDSDDSASEMDMDHDQTNIPSPTKSTQLGAGFLSAEKRLNEFLQAPLVNSNHKSENMAKSDTPRCFFTGAEKFLEIAESIDLDNTGLLHEDEFARVIAKCGVDVAPDLLTGILSRFPRSSGKFIRYSDFLQRYGQNPQCARGRRELKQRILQLLARASVPTKEWLRFLLQRFESHDKKVHGSLKGTLPTEDFMRAIQGRSVVLKLTTDEAAQVTSLFRRSFMNNSSTHFHYHEFIRFVDECHRVPALVIDTTPASCKASVINSPLPVSPKATKLSQPDPSEIDASDMSVGDYLMFHAKPQERRNFENLMELLKEFQEKAEGQEPTILRIADGIMMPLGQRLRVTVQFSLER